MRIAVLGVAGRMGQALVRAIDAAAPDAALTSATERPGSPMVGQNVTSSGFLRPTDVVITDGVPATGVADVWIDFTVPAATTAYTEAAVAANAALVIGTTGLGPEQRAAIDRAAKRIPIVFLSAVNKETEHLIRGYAMGAVDYVFKPVDPVVLRSKVAVFVDLFAMTKEIQRKAKQEQALLGKIALGDFDQEVHRHGFILVSPTLGRVDNVRDRMEDFSRSERNETLQGFDEMMSN